MKTYSICRSCGKTNRVDALKSFESQARCGHCKSDLILKNGMNEVNLSQLRQLISAADIPVVVDLWAPWCGPCVSFAPTFQKLAKEQAGQFVFAKVNTEQHPDASQFLGVRGIPTLVAFQSGQEVKRQAGAMPEAMFREWLRSILL